MSVTMRDEPLPARSPLEALREPLLAALARAPVVVVAPTGAGKSTEIPRWLTGKVLVVEPRRVACRGLAQRIAELERVKLGGAVGYRVRDDDRSSARTRLLLATPGIVLQSPELLGQYDTVVLDEFHERRLDVDLILTWLLARSARFLVMSATLDGQRVADHIGGTLLSHEVRSFPVTIEYEAEASALPSGRQLDTRVAQVVRSLSADPGDSLVFLPGKAEIRAAQQALRGAGAEVLPLHGGLTLEVQSRVFSPSSRRRVILATNVAETSVTVPNVRVVIDSGLVRRTHYHQGRAYLALCNVALDSATQRAGRAGRTAAGRCIRLWGARAQLAARTLPEIYRESLASLVLAAAAHGPHPAELRFLDPPKPYAWEAAEAQLVALGALDRAGALTKIGRRLSQLPLDPWLGRLLVEAQVQGHLAPIIDLVAVLEQGHPERFLTLLEGQQDAPQPSDATHLMEVLRRASPRKHSAEAWLLSEARQTARRLRRVFGVPSRSAPPALERTTLHQILLAADPRSVHVARRRRGRTAWSNGGTEIELSPESVVAGRQRVEAIFVLGARGHGSGARDRRIIATVASAVQLDWLCRQQLGSERLAQVKLLPSDRMTVTAERVYAGRVIGKREATPTGVLARKAIARLFLEGRLHPEALAETRRRLTYRALVHQLHHTPGFEHLAGTQLQTAPRLEDWIVARLEALGVETGDDLQLLEAQDLVATDLPAHVRAAVTREFPLEIDLGDCVYAVEYDLKRRQALLSIVRGSRAAAPPLAYLPRLGGFRLCVEAGGRFHVLRDR